MLEMLHVVLPEHLDFASEFIIRAAHDLVLTRVSVAIEVLPLDLLSAFVFALDDLVEAALIVLRKVLDDDDC